MFYAGGAEYHKQLNLSLKRFGSSNCHYGERFVFGGLFLFCFLFSLRLFYCLFFLLNNYGYTG